MKYAKYIFILAGVLFIWLFVKSCDGPEAQVDTTELPQQELLRVGVGNNAITVQTSKETETQYLPEEGAASITVDKAGNVTFDVKNKGFVLRPVMGVFLATGVNGVLGLQVGYWNRFEMYGGITAPQLAGLAAVGYRLDQIKLKNTSLYVAYTSRKEIGAGLFVRF